jgi:hypothetical protein
MKFPGLRMFGIVPDPFYVERHLSIGSVARTLSASLQGRTQ